MIIENNKILLKNIEVSDTDNIIRWRNKKAVIDKFLDQNILDRETHLKWLKDSVETGNVKQFIIYLKPENIPVGSVFLKDIDLKNKKAEYGIFIGEDFARGRGVGTNAAKLIIEYGFIDLCLHKIFLRVLSDNKQAIKSYEKAGFGQEAYLKDEVFINGEFRDIIFMAILNHNGG